ncbi:hypothetical protein [Rickettsia hoogstraalii]|uniref:hypothetical protein n=1 Tax=Rickettsia hoogstraalii TaxID=467174 RepID=UPI000B21E233|nr:hypothetical protein [Rickettsia hoogstraalii]
MRGNCVTIDEAISGVLFHEIATRSLWLLAMMEWCPRNNVSSDENTTMPARNDVENYAVT